MSKNSKLHNAVRLALGFSAGALSLSVAPGAFAQEAQADQDQMIEEIVTTGSRIKRDGYDSVSPIVVATAEDIKVSGQTRLEDMLNQLPSIEAAQTSFISNGSSGTASVDLRGLGANRTLVLVNGRRLQPGGIYSQAPDINQIPSALVDRVEVLTGGASATYGADAVAGVVNFIMRKDFEGVEINAGMSGYQHNNDNGYIQSKMDARDFSYPTGSSGIDGKSYNIDFTLGSSFADGKGSAVGYATYRTNDELRQGARDYSSCALSATATSCGGSANAIHPNFIIGLTDLSDYDYWTLDPNSDGFITDSNLWNPEPYNYAPVNHFMRPDTRYSLGAFLNYEANDNFKPYMETSFTSDRTRAQIAESGTFFNTYYEIPLNSPTISDTQRAQIAARFGLDPATDSFGAYIGKRNVEGGPRTDILEHQAFRIVIGAEGDINDDWSYDVSYQHGQTSSGSTYINDFFDPRVEVALNADDCAATSGCSVYDVFTWDGVTPEQAAYVVGTGILNGKTEERIFNAYVSGDLGWTLPTASTPVAVVAGFEHREERFERNSDDVFAYGLLLGQGGATPSISGSYSVSELFAEAQVPVLETLSVDLGYRYSDYDLFDSTSTYKIGAEWDVIDMVKVRGGYNRAVRVPNVAELFTPNSKGLWSGTDACSGSAAEIAARGLNEAMCANTGVTAAQYGNISASPASQYNGLYGGNINLDPEVADTYTFGVVVTPMDNLRFSVDYWNIEIEDVITTIGGELIVEQCALSGDAQFCNLINRSGTGSLWLGTEGYVTDTNINSGTNKWEGIDFAATWNLEVLGGNLLLTGQATQMLTKTVEPIKVSNAAAAEAVYDCVGFLNTDCFATPKWRSTLSATYDMGTAWTANMRIRTQGKVNYNGTRDTIADGNLGAVHYLDISGGYEFDNGIALYLGINNILDEEPPMVGSTLSSNANAAAGNYDMLGRQLFLNAKMKF